MSFCAFSWLKQNTVLIGVNPRLKKAGTPKVKKCKKMVQNMLKTCSFLAKRCKKALIFDKKAPKNAHFYPHF